MSPFRGRVGPIARFLAESFLFGIAYTQAPLYFSNQNQYFLHGLAYAGSGALDVDWLANTADPTPLFSTLVTAIAWCGQAWLFYAVYVLLLGVYFHALLDLGQLVAGPKDPRLFRFTLAALLVLSHSALARYVSYRIVGQDYPWYLQAGLAGQYVLGPVLQPSTFGVFLLWSIVVFCQERPFLAVFLAVLAATWHSTYLLAAGVLTLTYILMFMSYGQARRALFMGLLACVLVAPAVLYAVVTFGPATSETFAEARHILVHQRIPHHAIVDRWCDGIALLQIAWIALAITLIRGSRLGAVLGSLFLAGILLTVLQLLTASDALALLFPWRFSVLLIPAATAVVFSKVITLGLRSVPSWNLARRHCLEAADLVIIAAALLGGAFIMERKMGYRGGGEETALLTFVKDTAKRGDLYFVPVNRPNPNPSRGSISADFRPPPPSDPNSRVIPFELQRFRLATGAPIFVDSKSIPYKDVEVLEWHRRVETCLKTFDLLERKGFAEARAELRECGATHLVAPAGMEIHAPGFRDVYGDRYYRVYRLTPDER